MHRLHLLFRPLRRKVLLFKLFKVRFDIALISHRENAVRAARWKLFERHHQLQLDLHNLEGL